MFAFYLAKTDSQSAALGYFITPCVATVLTLCCYLVLPHLVRSFIIAFLVYKNGELQDSDCQIEVWEA